MGLEIIVLDLQRPLKLEVKAFVNVRDAIGEFWYVFRQRGL